MGSLAHWRRHVKENLLVDGTIEQTLSRDVIDEFCRRFGYRWRESFWNPTVTLAAFLGQVLDGAKTLRAAVAALLAQRAARGETDLPSCDPSAYCQARIRLPVAVVTAMLGHVAHRLRGLVNASNAWLGRRVWIVDGSSASMPDKPSLQKVFPQPSGQRPGCGFPVAQFVALFCWTTGAIVDVMIDSIVPHELTLFRKLWHHFESGCVVLADRAYGSYVDLARLLERKVYSVFRLRSVRLQRRFRHRPARFRRICRGVEWSLAPAALLDSNRPATCLQIPLPLSDKTDRIEWSRFPGVGV